MTWIELLGCVFFFILFFLPVLVVKNLQDAWRWILSLNAGGSTNTLAALRLALADASVQAVYVLTDGRPDQVCI